MTEVQDALKLSEQSSRDAALRLMTDARKAHDWTKTSKTNPGDTGGANALYGGILDNGKTWQQRYACHAFIRHNANTKVLWSAYSYKNEKIGRQYFNWLLHDSPWSKIGIVPSLLEETMFEQGFVFTGLDKVPGNLLHNFLIATRMAAEWPRYIEGWSKLVKDGIDSNLAFLMMTVFKPFDPNGTKPDKTFLDEKSSILADQDKYDWPLDMARCNEEYVRNFLTGKTVGLNSVMYYPTSSTVPVNTLWGSVSDKDKYVNLLKRLYSGFFKEEEIEYKSWTGIEKRKIQSISQKDIIQIIKEEEIRLGLKEMKRAA